MSFTIFTASVRKILDTTSYVNLGVSIVFELHIVSVSQVFIEAQSTISFSV